MDNSRIQGRDPSDDGHPCEVAVAFREAAIKAGVIDEIPADALDLAIQFAWIGKAVSRTVHMHEWFVCGVDPNTRWMVAALAVDASAREEALRHALVGKAASGLDENLRSVRRSLAFGHALKVVQSVCGRNPGVSEVERLAVLARLAGKMPDTKRFRRPGPIGVISLEAFRKLRKLAV